MWPMLALAAGGALMGGLQQSQQRKDQQAFNAGQIEANRYSPWTGMHDDVKAATASPMNGVMQGALSGGLFGANLARQNPTSGQPGGAPSPMQEMGKDNGMMMDAGRYDQMQGVKDSSAWGRLPNFYSGSDYGRTA